MPDSQVEEIKNRLDLAELIRGYMKIEKAGINLRGVCPFHREKSPSFFVSPARQLWKCFGCGVGGDIFSFVMQIEGADFKEALAILADKAGVRLRTFDPRVRSEKARLYEVCEKACQFFEKQLNATLLGQEAKKYLRERGISDESIKGFRVGFAPNKYGSLHEFLRSQGYSPSEIFKSGVSIQKPSSNSSQFASYDRFRGRIMFPIFDLSGQAIGFGGRVFFAKNQIVDTNLAKYINTPQTLLYDKSNILYGLDVAKHKIRESNECILVEGYTDVIMAHQAGTTNVVSVSGTALTERQLALIHRYTPNLITCFDMDIAGDNATKRGIEMAQQQGFNIKVALLPSGKDPADIIKQNKSRWNKAIEKSLSIGDFYFATAFSRFDRKLPEGIRNISAMILPMIKHIPTQIEQSFWVQKLSTELLCPENVIWNDLKKTSSPEEPKEITNKDSKIKTEPGSLTRTKRDMLYERILILFSRDPKCVRTIKKKDLVLFKNNENFYDIIHRARKYARENEMALSDPSAFINSFCGTLPVPSRTLFNNLLFGEEVFPILDSATDIQTEFDLCVNSLKQFHLKEHLLGLQLKLRKDPQDKEILADFKKASIDLAKFNT